VSEFKYYLKTNSRLAAYSIIQRGLSEFEDISVQSILDSNDIKALELKIQSPPDQATRKLRKQDLKNSSISSHWNKDLKELAPKESRIYLTLQEDKNSDGSSALFIELSSQALTRDGNHSLKRRLNELFERIRFLDSVQSSIDSQHSPTLLTDSL